MTLRGITRFLPLALALACFPPGPAFAADSKAHNLYLQGAKLFEQEKHDEAIMVLKKAVKLQPKFPEAYRLMAEVYFEGKRRPSDAISAVKQAIEQKPNFPEAYYLLGSVYQTQGKFRDAEQALRQAIKLNPKYEEAYWILGR